MTLAMHVEIMLVCTLNAGMACLTAFACWDTVSGFLGL